MKKVILWLSTHWLQTCFYLKLFHRWAAKHNWIKLPVTPSSSTCLEKTQKGVGFKTIGLSSTGWNETASLCRSEVSTHLFTVRFLSCIKDSTILNETRARLRHRRQMHLVSHNSNFSNNKSILASSAITAVDADVWGNFEEEKIPWLDQQ